MRRVANLTAAFANYKFTVLNILQPAANLTRLDRRKGNIALNFATRPGTQQCYGCDSCTIVVRLGIYRLYNIISVLLFMLECPSVNSLGEFPQ
jgi:hypothetical protein